MPGVVKKKTRAISKSVQPTRRSTRSTRSTKSVFLIIHDHDDYESRPEIVFCGSSLKRAQEELVEMLQPDNLGWNDSDQHHFYCSKNRMRVRWQYGPFPKYVWKNGSYWIEELPMDTPGEYARYKPKGTIVHPIPEGLFPGHETKKVATKE